MKSIAFDFHGTTETYPHIFKPMMSLLMNSGVSIFVMSGPETDKIIKALECLDYRIGTHYLAVFSIIDFLTEQYGVEFKTDDQGNKWTDDTTWWSSKYKMCQFYNIDVLVDDNLSYKPFFKYGSEKFVHWDRRHYD